MAPSRGKGKANTSNVPVTSARSTRLSARQPVVPHVYQDLLAEASATESTDAYPDRPLKKRKVDGSASNAKHNDDRSKNSAAKVQQSVEETDESAAEEDSDGSELAFEDVDLDQPNAGTPDPEDESDEAIQDLTISVDASTETARRRTQANRTKPISASEKAFRILVHKAHILCLLGHCMFLNGRCSAEAVQRHLRSKLSKRTFSYLNPSADDSQFQRDRSFRDGLQQASDAWRGMFTVTGGGTRRAQWPIDGQINGAQSNESEIVDRAEFIKAAKEMQGSQDTANQLLCALLRSVGVEARLVCSLQVLPFANAPSKGNTPQKATKQTFYAATPTLNSVNNDTDGSDTAVQSSSSIGKVPSARRRLGQPSFTTEPPVPSTGPQKKRPLRSKLAYPIFWTEAFNTAQQKWIPIDSIVTQTVSKPSKLEPPSSYEHNQMVYVIAFEADGVARDITRRYAKAYNAKTRRMRVESADTKDGAEWLKKALRIFRRHGRRLDRDQLEDAELAQKEAREGMPGNVQDFKDHPIYALERHLKRHEVIWPKREVGKVNAGTAAKPRMEAVFRRGDVKIVRSSEKWYRFGRVIKEGEQGVKSVPARKGVGQRRKEGENGVVDMFGEASEEAIEMTALYTESQTEPYIAPPILVDGKVPKNAFGNLDIYVPSMVPAGGVHIRHPRTQDAARLLGVSYSDAVTGFQFKGRHGTAVIEGAVVAQRNEEAVRAVIESLEVEQAEEKSRERSLVALRVWRRFLKSLRVAERVKGYGDIDGGTAENADVDVVGDSGGADHLLSLSGGEDEELSTAGLYTLEELMMPTAKVSSRKKTKKVAQEESEEAVSSSYEDGDEEDYFEPSTMSTRRNRHVVDEDSEDEYIPDADSSGPYGDDHGGRGFLADDRVNDDGVGGGFLPENDTDVNDYGGGFMPDDGDTMETNNDADSNGRGGGFLPDDDHGDSFPEALGFNETVDEASMVTGNTQRYPALENEVASPKYSDIGGGLLTNAETPSQGQVPSTSLAGPAAEVIDYDQNTETTFHKLDDETNHVIRPADLDTTVCAENASALPPVQISDAEANDHDTEKADAAQYGIEDVQETNIDVDDAHSDHGSMLSHDPDDEDAEPFWPASDSD